MCLIGILHPVVITGDLARALKFYRDILGFVPRPVTTHDPERLRRLGGPAEAVAQAVILHAPDGSELEIASFTHPAGAPRTSAGWSDAGIRSITFKVGDLAATVARLAAAGHPMAGEIVPFIVEGSEVLAAYVAGPDGVVLTLIEQRS